MSRPSYNSTDIDLLRNKIERALSSDRGVWYHNSLLTESYSEKEFVIILDNLKDVTYLSDNYSFRWYCHDLVCFLLTMYDKYVDEVLAGCSDVGLAQKILRAGVIPMDKISVLADSPSKEVRKRVAEICDFETLKKLSKDRTLQVRKTAYQRLGPIGHLDEMLTDKSADIRLQGVSHAPMNYSKLSNMTNEISRGVFIELISKINKNDLPMLLSNRNLKDKYVSEVFQRRIESKV